MAISYFKKTQSITCIFIVKHLMYKYNQVMHKICKQFSSRRFKSLFIWRMFYEVNKYVFAILLDVVKLSFWWNRRLSIRVYRLLFFSSKQPWNSRWKKKNFISFCNDLYLAALHGEVQRFRFDNKLKLSICRTCNCVFSTSVYGIV